MPKIAVFIKASLLAGVLGAALALPAAAETRLRAGVFSPPDTTWGVPFKLFADHVNETGKGIVRIDVMGPDAIPAVEQVNALRGGVLDMVATPPGFYKQSLFEANAQDLSSMTLAEQRASGGYAALQELTREKVQAELLTTYGTGVNFHLYLTEQVEKPKDLEGLRLRSQPIFGPMFSDLGISGSVISIPETYTALERGVVKGYAFARWGVQDLGWDRLTKVRVEPGFYSVVVNILMNEQRYKSLTVEERKVIDDAVVWFEEMLPAYKAQEDAKHLAAQESAGIKSVDFGADFATRAADVYWEEMAKSSPESIARLRPLLQK